jgi:NAD(P)-dependent dehydrogenase (short-subunit alcohol dehydrogenase family)
MPNLTGRVIVVTGAGSGIGAEIARETLSAGAKVVALDRDTAGLEPLLESAPDSVLAARVDVTDEDDVSAALASGVRQFGKIDGLVNAAGIVVSGPFLEFSYEDWERSFRVNLWGSYLMLRSVVPLLQAAGGGSIVNFSSSGGKLSNPNTAPYAASKLAVISLTRSAAGELAPDIRVNAVVPGIIDTPMWAQLTKEYASRHLDVTMESRAAVTPMVRPGRPDDVAAAVLFLLSDEARFITGEDLNVSGGQVMF